MSNSNTISFEQFKQKKKEKDEKKRVVRTMVWLHCPECNTIEYSEIVAPHGRSHKCGSPVKEVPVEVDVKAELTIIEANLKQIDLLLAKQKKSKFFKLSSKSLTNALVSLRQSELIYRERLNPGDMKPLEGEIDDLKKTHNLPIVEKNSLGLHISEFRFHPEERFKPEDIS